MLPKTHRFIIEKAITCCGSWAREYRNDILRGNDDEDVHIVPLVGWRLRAAGLTHTHVPGGHFGEMLFPSAKKQAAAFFAKAQKSLNHPAKRAWWMGRACHLLGDTAVPARALRVWHIEGDPLEAWLEKHLHVFVDLKWEEADEAVTPDEIFEKMARLAASFPVDTTRTPWGRTTWQWFHKGKQLDAEECLCQARTLLPMAIRMTRNLITWAERS